MTYKEERIAGRLAETQSVKAALTQAGYTGVKVEHGRGTACGWLHVKADEKPGQTWREKNADCERIAQQVTGRQGEYGGRINIS